MGIFDELIAELPEGIVEDVFIGLHWTLVTAKTQSGMVCGLAATQAGCCHGGIHSPSVKAAGQLCGMPALEMAALVHSESATEVSLGLAAINALTPRPPAGMPDLNADQYIAEHGRDKRVAVVGHFPFVDKIRPLAKSFWVLELEPGEGDQPAEEAPNVIPQADLVAITASTLSNGTFEGLIKLCRPDARVLLLGPSTPLSPVLYRHGVDVLSGTVVEDARVIYPLVAQAANFQQIRRCGAVRLVTMTRGDE